MSESQKSNTAKRWTQCDQLLKDWSGFGLYDNPFEAFLFGRVTSPKKLNSTEWELWKKEHYVGFGAYDSKTGEVIDPKLRKFFDRWYPNWHEGQIEEPDEDYCADIDTEDQYCRVD